MLDIRQSIYEVQHIEGLIIFCYLTQVFNQIYGLLSSNGRKDCFVRKGERPQIQRCKDQALEQKRREREEQHGSVPLNGEGDARNRLARDLTAYTRVGPSTAWHRMSILGEPAGHRPIPLRSIKQEDRNSVPVAGGG